MTNRHNDKNLEYLEQLDILITSHFNSFNKNDKNPTTGDLLKMVKLLELRRKLTPKGSSQKKLWKMIDIIRKEELTENHETEQTNQKRKHRYAKK